MRLKTIERTRNAGLRLFAGWALVVLVLGGLAGASEIAIADVVDAKVLGAAARDIAAGRFVEGRNRLGSVNDGPWGSARSKLGSLVSREAELVADTRAEHHKVYDEHVAGLRNAVERARWRTGMLEASEAYKVGEVTASEEMDPNLSIAHLKEKTEEEYRGDIRKDWLTALAKLAVAHNMGEKLELPKKVAAELRTAVMARGIEIGRKMEEAGEWLDAYSQVYYYLAELDKANADYEEHKRVLLRRVMVTEMYAPDPNQVGVSWQDRRAGVTDDIVEASLNMLRQGYVTEPDWKQMSLLGLQNCLLLVETEKVGEAFEQLKDAKKVSAFREAVTELYEDAKEGGQDWFDYRRLRGYYKAVLRINDSTLKLPGEVMRAEFAEGMYEGVDAYTYAVWPGDTAEFRKDMTSEFSGVGIVINKAGGLLKVDSLLEKSPALRAGLDAGDTIVEVDHQSTKNITLQMAVRRITGKQGTDVILTIDREGFEEPRDFTVKRERVVVKSVKGLYRDGGGAWQHFADPNEGVAYIRLTNFVGETHQSLVRTLEELRAKGMRALILDLRNNGGGFLSSAVEVVDTFVDEGVIVSTRGRIRRLSSIEEARKRSTFDSGLPLVVLINAASASASEIVSGSLKDHGRALIIGTRSLGKGSVQQIQPLRPSDAELKLTIAYYYLPSGRRVHRDPKDRLNKDYGVEPHITLELVGEHLKEMYKVRAAAGILHLNKYKNSEAPWHIYTSDEMVASDPQLNLAVLCLSGELLARSLGEYEHVAAEAGPEAVW